ncbi:MAG: hypothetical protein PHQ11_05055 [Paludibacter sp.]|nr:hypothetical protein [Paludibacter sp.]
MKKIILYIAASLDQRIAESNSGLEWLTGFPNPQKTDYGYNDLLASVDTVYGRTYLPRTSKYGCNLAVPGTNDLCCCPPRLGRNGKHSFHYGERH